tara:strand:+ start:76 stop:663 length:588 start_codon:yes stop_codon:yes gene_type:complete
MKEASSLFVLLFVLACSESTSSQIVLTEEEKLIQAELLKQEYANFKSIYGESSKATKKDLKNYMINVIVENPECIPEYVDSSINAKNTYYLLCSNLEKIYWTVNDMQNNQVKGFAKHLDDSKAISYCESLISEELTNPSTFKRKTFDTSVTKVKQGRSQVYMGFSAKNGIGMDVNFKARCLVGDGVAEIQMFEQI